MFTSRFVVQWYASEKLKQSVIPKNFWHLSLRRRDDPVDLRAARRRRSLSFLVRVAAAGRRGAQPDAHRAAPASASRRRSRPTRLCPTTAAERRPRPNRAFRPKMFPFIRGRSSARTGTRDRQPAFAVRPPRAMKPLALSVRRRQRAVPRRLRGATERPGGHRTRSERWYRHRTDPAAFFAGDAKGTGPRVFHRGFMTRRRGRTRPRPAISPQ